MMDKTAIRLVVFKDGDHYIAQALEVDIAAQGDTPEEASRRLGIALNAEARDAKAEGRNLLDLGPAPETVRVLYEDRVVSREQKMVA
ncbi:MAG: hypothetical protein E5W53_05330 [Mesorhizobium sp.]|uniref:hypothetical protein n=1 Tax=unclassified Mesorhizobium TaxID=325217 RepID=UPI000FE73F0A|nr:MULTISPECIES: hypothetical protein [unclassified Mesorhizobium]RWC13942.1 MAG: hypothetical protein EOS51_20350 [Mesorhizobium sp.]TGT98665.1 hypothetical protein EN807_01540 [Mesorhizobium sp. M5C.F.Ca.ET.164.01.1.1]TIU26817.1 MAG: hypothetical protein E5W53_05330 [Mesorhizobium sp.]